jgi:phage host-nuclease inhibitor protein Gam
MAEGDGFNYTENLAAIRQAQIAAGESQTAIRERLARVEARIEDVAGIRMEITKLTDQVRAYCESSSVDRTDLRAQVMNNKRMLWFNLSTVLALAGKLIWDSIAH